MVQGFHNPRSLSKIVQFNFCSIYSLKKYCLLLHTELNLSNLMTLSADLVPKRTVQNKEAKLSMIFQCYEGCITVLVFLHNSLVIIFLGAIVMQEAIDKVPVFICRISLQLAAGLAQGHLGLSPDKNICLDTDCNRHVTIPVHDCPMACWQKHTVYAGLQVPVSDRYFGCNNNV